MKRIAILIALGILLVPQISFAANATFFGPIIPEVCNCKDQPNPDGGDPITTAPDYGCVLQVVQNVINMLISFSIILITLYIAYAGLMMVLSGGNPGKHEAARTRVVNAVAGLVVVLCAWLIIDFVMKTLYDEKGTLGPWNSILADDEGNQCVVAKKPQGLIDGFLDPLTSAPTVSTTGGVSGGSAGGNVSGVSGGNTKLDVTKAASYATANARNSSTGWCAKYVRIALAAGGLTSFNTNRPGYAYQYGPYLTAAGFSAIKSGSYSPSLENNIAGLRKGDVVVFDRVRGHSSGHIAIFNGSQWVSDYRQSTMSSNPSNYTGGNYIIYRP